MSKFLFDMTGEIDSFVGLIFSSDNLKEATIALHVNPEKYVIFLGTDEVCACRYKTVLLFMFSFSLYWDLLHWVFIL